MDALGVEGPASEEYCVMCDASTAPDLACTSLDISLYPPIPVEGEEVAVSAVIKYTGVVDIEGVIVNGYLRDGAGNLELIGIEEISSLAANSQETVSDSDTPTVL